MIDISSIDKIIDDILFKGLVKNNKNLSICCPDCIQNMNGNDVGIYVLASVEEYLKFAEAVGCTQAAVALSDTTEQPLGAVDDSGCNCCTHIYASVETGLKHMEAIPNYDPSNTTPPCVDNFNNCIDTILNNSDEDTQEVYLDKGIVEYGSLNGLSQICTINEYAELIFQTGLTYGFSITKTQIITRILDKGIVISCLNDEIVIASIETWLVDYAESRGLLFNFY
jgi:hypothetical protein